MIMPINATSSVSETAMAMREAFTARSFSHQLVGLMPCSKNVDTPARFTQIRFTRNNENAPKASVGCPPPSSSPDVTSGGNNATATMTPINVADTPVVNASAPALPDAKATAMSPKLTRVRTIFRMMSGPR